jgi:Uma2 family endonuclease
VRNGDEVKPPAPSVKFTYEDLAGFPDDGRRHEIVEGDHYVTPSPNVKHQAVLGNLMTALRNSLEDDPRGFVFVAPLDVVLSDLNVVEPDLMYISRERRAILTDQNVRGAPDLLVEILSSGTRKTDEMVKRKVYERYGVAEYWVIDPELDAIKIYRREGDAFVRAADLNAEHGDTLTTPLLPQFSIGLGEVFALPV